MPLSTEHKAEIVKKYGRTEGDTGSPEVQIALLTARIQHLTEHLRTHIHDHATRRGLMMLVGERKRLMEYLARIDITRFRTVVASLGIRAKI